jgi:2-oxoisovalerate dehydrogenase E1 component
MNLYSLHAPQLGEGLKSVVVTAFLKKQGDRVRKDEPILLVETQKAAMEIESPVSGIVHELKVPLREKVPVGRELLNIRIEDEGKPAGRGQDKEGSHAPAMPASEGKISDPPFHQGFTGRSVSPRQSMLIKAMRGSSRHVIPSFVQRTIDARPLQDLRKAFRQGATPGSQIPSSTEIFAWCALQSMKQNPRFRSVILDDDQTIQEYPHGSVGIAVGLPGDDLSTVKIAGDEYGDFRSFAGICRTRITDAKAGIDHNGPHCVTISDLCALGIETSVPVIVSPAVATLAIGKGEQVRETFILSLSFDHRLINGAGAAGFLTDLKSALNDIKPVITRSLMQPIQNHH